MLDASIICSQKIDVNFQFRTFIWIISTKIEADKLRESATITKIYFGIQIRMRN